MLQTLSPNSILEARFPTLRVRFCLPFRSFTISTRKRENQIILLVVVQMLYVDGVFDAV